MKEPHCGPDHCFLCRHCSSEWRELIRLKKRTLFFRKGRNIIEEGNPVMGMFFIPDHGGGAVKVTKNWGADKQLIIRFAGPGDVLGHRGFGRELIYPVSAVALEDTHVCFIDNALFEASLKTNPAFAFAFLEVYANDLQKAEQRMRDLAHRDGKGRIVLALFEAEHVFGKDDEGFIRVPITRQDIASHAGTSYETVFKFFSEWSQAGSISTSGKSIRITDRDALQRVLSENNINN